MKKTVLVVDDSSLMRRLVSEIVESDSELHVVDVAENGKIALQKVRIHKPDCILLDIEMPELSGLDTLRRLGLRSSSRIVILSSLGYEGSPERAEALRLGSRRCYRQAIRLRKHGHKERERFPDQHHSAPRAGTAVDSGNRR